MLRPQNLELGAWTKNPVRSDRATQHTFDTFWHNILHPTKILDLKYEDDKARVCMCGWWMIRWIQDWNGKVAIFLTKVGFTDLRFICKEAVVFVCPYSLNVFLLATGTQIARSPSSQARERLCRSRRWEKLRFRLCCARILPTASVQANKLPKLYGHSNQLSNFTQISLKVLPLEDGTLEFWTKFCKESLEPNEPSISDEIRLRTPKNRQLGWLLC